MKQISKTDLTTEYAEGIGEGIPHGYYPRPQLVRDSFLCLNGEWDFCIAGENDAPEFDSKILVPFPPESPLSGICLTPDAGEILHYRRTFSVPGVFLRERLILHFGAVDQIAEVYINGKEAGRHEGGYIPFSLDITSLISSGENEICVRARDDLDPAYPYGKQTKRRGGMWYTPVSGIWQSVWIEALPENHIESIKLTPDMNGVTLTVIGGEDEKLLTIPDENIKYEFRGSTLRIDFDKPRLWSPADPYLYRFTLKSGDDEVESYFALREIGQRWVNGRAVLTLNGKPCLFSGLLDQGYYPDGLFLPATEEGYSRDILLAKSMGFNMLRKHIKIEPMIFYHLCDKLGMIVFQDMVNNGKYSFIRDTLLPTVGIKRIPDEKLHRDERGRQIFLDTMEKTAELLYNTPSVVYYTIFNEGWGQFLADEAYDRLSSLDKTRIIDATSGWFKRKRSDVDSRHIYFKKLSFKRPAPRPAVLSEFGGYSHRVENHVFGKAEYGYRRYSKAGEYEWRVLSLYEDEVIPLVERGICALVYTQLSDVEDETNGLVTYDRRVVKLDEERMLRANNRLYKAFSEKYN